MTKVTKAKNTSIQKKRTIKKKRLLKSLQQNNGIISHACDAAKISRKTYYEWMQQDEDFATAVDEIQEGVIDVVENELMKQIKEGNTTASIFFLKTRGKHRGYIERSEVEHKGGPVSAIQIIVNEAEDKHD